MTSRALYFPTLQLFSLPIHLEICCLLLELLEIKKYLLLFGSNTVLEFFHLYDPYFPIKSHTSIKKTENIERPEEEY